MEILPTREFHKKMKKEVVELVVSEITLNVFKLLERLPGIFITETMQDTE
jgi:hypothetical protein